MFRRLLREYLSITSGERRGFLVLASLVLAMILLRIMMPELLHRPPLAATSPLPAPSKPGLHTGSLSDQGAAPDTSAAPDFSSVLAPSAGSHQTTVPGYFYFDPNSAGLDTLIELGMAPGTARTLVNYREHGGRFRKKEDLRKIYGLKEKDYLLMEPWIRIKDMADSLAAGFDLNLADTSLLMGVRGIGPVFSRRIIMFRELLGGFYSMDQLHEVYGLSEEQFSSLSVSCYADSSRICMMDLNTAEREELEKHPYLDAYQVSALLSYRNLTGGFKHLDEIQENRLLPPQVFSKISPYLKVSH